MNAKDAWLATLGQLQVQLNRSTYDTWLRRADLLAYEDGRFVVSVPNAYARDWIERHLLEAMTQTLSGIFRRSCEIQVIVWNPADAKPSAVADPAPPLLAYAETVERIEAGEILNPDYTFENLVVGEANRYAVLLATSLLNGMIGKYSSVYFYGSLGLGKTHLLQAVAQGLIEHGLSVLYITAENFTNELIQTIRERGGSEFREKYRKADAVLIDDLQFIEGKESTQAELVAIWDALRNRQRTLIFAADRLPRDMQKVTGDARSRFQAGPIAAIEPPDLALRRDILDFKARRRGMQLPADVRDLLAARITTTIRDLESAVEQIHSYCNLTRQPVDLAAAQSTLKALGSASAESASLETVLSAIAAHYGLQPGDLASRKRTKIVAHARQLAMYLARECTDASLPQIGAALGGRDHSTVMHGLARITELLATDAGVAADVDAIRDRLTERRPNSGTAITANTPKVAEAVPVRRA